jgi:hypothetical protein
MLTGGCGKLGPMHRLVPASALALLLALGATGCAAETAREPQRDPSPSATGLSVAEACETVDAAVRDAAAAVAELDPTDPQAATAAFGGIAESLGAAADEVAGSELASLLPTMRDGFTSAAGELTAIAGGDLSRLDELQAATAVIGDALSSYAAMCRGD